MVMVMMMVMVRLVDALGITPKFMERRLEKLEIKGRIKIIMTAVLLKLFWLGFMAYQPE